MPVSDPKISVRDLLDNNWDHSNTVISEDPLIHTGWFNHDWSGRAQVTVTDADEDAIGGATGFSGISASGEGLQIELGQMFVGCWATDPMYDGAHFKQVAYDLSEEVKRIVLDNTFGISDMQWVAWKGRRDVIDRDADPILYRYECTVVYQYLEETG